MSAEYQSFRRHFADISESIQNPTTLASRLYSAGMLSRERRNNIGSLQLSVEQIGQLLDALEGQIKVDSQNFYKFVDELEKDKPMCHLCDKLRLTCDQLKSHNPELITQDPPLKKSATIKSQYKVFLKDCYRQPLPNDDKLLFSASKCYIKLAVVSMHSRMTRKKAEADEFIKMSLHGFDEEILREKAPNALADILKPREDGKPVRCVLVEGSPGIGKSTLAWELCHKWEELDSVKQYDLVVLVQLREKKAQEARCLKDLLPCNTDINIKKLVAALGRGKGVLIVCDGFDELPHQQYQKGSVYIDLLKGVLLPEATIIVTSRPSVSDSLLIHCQYSIDRHIEILGFTKEEIKHFAESIFSGDLLKGFLTYITSNPFIHGMMYVPLNAVIIALIYQYNYNENTPFPTTMTQLFDALTRALIRRHLVSMQSVPLQDFRMPPSIQCMEDIYRLPPFVAQQLLELAKMAYESVHKKMYVFTNLGEDFEPRALGLMKKTTRLNVSTGRECSYTFLHLTLQEYMATLFIAILCPSGLGLYRRSIAFTTAYDVVLRFLAGVCRNHDVQSLCYQELVKMLDRRCSALQLLRCAFECPSIVQTMKVNYAELDVMGFSGVVAFDWYITGYCISHFDVKWDISIFYATEGCINLLVKGLRSSPTTKGKISILSVSSKFSKIFTQLREFCQLDTLILHCDVDDSHKEILYQLMIAPGSELKRLLAARKCAASIMALTLSQSSLEELAILTTSIHSNMKQLRTELLPILPQRNTNLKKLAVSSELIKPLATLLPNIASMTHLEIVGEVTDSIMPVLITIVQSLHTLKVLKVTNEYNTVRHQLKDDETCLMRANIAYSNIYCYTLYTDLSELVEAAASNSPLKEVILPRYAYQKLPKHIKTRHQQLLKCNDDFFITTNPYSQNN